MSSYNILENGHRSEIIIKNSRFITDVIHCESQKNLRAYYKELEIEHPKARHYCWAMIAGAPNDSSGYGFSDDGEPSGTAGKPIFNVLSHANAGRCAVIVTRYFGGIKLGTGGLVKAYTEATKAGIEASVWKPFIPTVVLQATLPFATESDLRHYCNLYDAIITEISYSTHVTASISLAASKAELFKKAITQDLHQIQF